MADPPTVDVNAEHLIGNVDERGRAVAVFDSTDSLGAVTNDEDFLSYEPPDHGRTWELERSHPDWKQRNVPEGPDRKMEDDTRWRAPGVPNIEFYESEKTAENACLPALPMPLRKWGREGILLLRVTGLPGVKYAVVVPDDVAVGRYCGLLAGSANTEKNHNTSHPWCNDNYGNSDVKLKCRRGRPVNYEVLAVSNKHAKWVTQCYRDAPEPRFADKNVNQDLDNDDDAVSDEEAAVEWVPPPHPVQPDLTRLSEGTVPPMEDPLEKCAGTRARVTPAAIRMLGMFGVHIVKVKNVRNVLWAVILPPGIPVMKWCGFLCWNANTTSKHHDDCPLCTLNAKEPDAPKVSMGSIETTSNAPVYKAFGCSGPWADWCNKIIALENQRRVDGKPYDFPDEFHIDAMKAKNQVLADRRRRERIKRREAAQLGEKIDEEVAERVTRALRLKLEKAQKKIEDDAAAKTREQIMAIIDKGVSLEDAKAHPDRVTPGLTPFKRKADCFYPENWNDMGESEKDAWIEETEKNYNPRSLEMD